jgi:hypothetical protein
MNDEETVPGSGPMVLRGVKKRIVPFEAEDPSIEPLFINFAHGAFLGDDCYLDVGVITLESVDPVANPDKIGDFVVLSRLVMSKRTMIAIRDQINNILVGGEASAP